MRVKIPQNLLNYTSGAAKDKNMPFGDFSPRSLNYKMTPSGFLKFNWNCQNGGLETGSGKNFNRSNRLAQHIENFNTFK